MRAMLLEFPDDPACDYLDRQYMLGDALLVAPVLTLEGTVDYYLPGGLWTDFLTGRVVEGGRWVREQHGFMSVPLLVRPNCVVAVGANDQRPDYDYTDSVTFHVFAPADGAVIQDSVRSLKGETALTVEIRRNGQTVQMNAHGATQSWHVLLRGVDTVQTVAGGTARPDALGTLLTPAAGSGEMTVRL